MRRSYAFAESCGGSSGLAVALTRSGGRTLAGSMAPSCGRGTRWPLGGVMVKLLRWAAESP